MADWRDGLAPVPDWRDGLKPQGTAPVDPKGPMAPGTSVRDLVGTGSNVLQMGGSGAQLGALFGNVPGAIAGGLIGGAAGAFMPPSETPLTDLGATAGDLLASRWVPGGASTMKRVLAKMGTSAGGTALGGLIGGAADKGLGFQKEIPFGTITMYSALTPLSAIAESLRSQASPTMEAAQKLKGLTGVEYPLSVAESTGRGGSMEKALTLGGNTSRALGREQEVASQKAFEQVLEAPLNKHLEIVLGGIKPVTEIREGVIEPWKEAWQKLNTKATQKAVGTGVYDASGKEVTTLKTVMEKPPRPSDLDFTSAFGLDKDQTREFLAGINAMPEKAVAQLLPVGGNEAGGLVKFRSIMTVLKATGHDVEMGKLGQAAVMQYLGTPNGPATGTSLAQKIYAGLGTAKEPGFLETALGPDRAQALKVLADVMASADPIEKVNAAAVPLTKRVAAYAFNKIVYASASMAATGLAGAQVPLGTFLLGTAGGAVAGISASALLGGLMMKPEMGKILIKASKGDTNAVGAILRTLAGSAKNAVTDDDSPQSKLQGLFVK